jgi:hypothetical protein
MRPVDTIPGMAWQVKKNDGEGEFNYDILLRTFKNKCHNVPPEQQ